MTLEEQITVAAQRLDETISQVEYHKGSIDQLTLIAERHNEAIKLINDMVVKLVRHLGLEGEQ